MENKIIKEVTKIIKKLNKKDAKILTTYVSGSECCIQNLANIALNFMESNGVESKSEHQTYKNIEKDYNIAKANYDYLCKQIIEKKK